MTNDKLIESFWSKFLEISQGIYLNPEDTSLINRLNGYINSYLGKFAWEYGPTIGQELYFCISPGLNKDLVPEVERILSKAPEIEHWQFLGYKPKKEWIKEWEVVGKGGKTKLINVEKWKCIIYKYPDGIYELEIAIGDFNGDEESAYSALDILLTNLLGEKKYMEKIEDVSIVEKFDPNVESKAIMVKDLDQYL